MSPDQESILQALFDHGAGPDFILDTQLRYVKFNTPHALALQTLYGTQASLGACLLDLIPEGPSRELARLNLERCLTGEIVVEETPYPMDNPPPVCYRVSHIPIKDRKGLITGILVNSLDITQEKKSAAQLALNDRNLQESLEASEIASWSYNGTTGESFYSDRYFTMLGYAARSLPSTLETWIGLLHPEDASSTVATFRFNIQTRTDRFQMEFRLRTATGGWKWILGQARVVERDSQGLPVRVVGTNQDITQRKLAEAALIESELRWTSLVDMAPVGITLLGEGGVILFVNRQEALLKGPVVLGRNWKEFLPVDQHAPLDRVLEQGFRAGESQVFASQVTLPSGQLAYFENHLSPILEDGGVSALMVVSIDVTAAEVVAQRRKKAARRMEILLSLHKEGQGEAHQLFDKALDAAVELTESQIGYIYFYDEQTQQFTLHSWSKSVMEACKVLDPLSQYSLERTGYWGEAVRQRRPIIVNDFQLPSHLHRGMPEGHVVLTRFLTIPVVQGGQIVAVVGVGNKTLPYETEDVEELTLLAESLWQLQRRRESEELLAQAQKMETVGQLAAGVAHDFNNLLTSVLGYNHMLLMKLATDNPLRVYAEKLEVSGRRAASLVAGLLAVGRRQRLNPVVMDLGTLLKDDEPLLSSMLKGTVRLVWNLSSEALSVEVDPGQISQVLVNLVSNAGDVLGDDGVITLSSGRRDDSQGSWAWFRVEDNGPGVPPAIRDKIFDPFFTTKGIGKGTGLGLSIVQGIVQQHRGTISLENTSGQGSSFLVCLPLI